MFRAIEMFRWGSVAWFVGGIAMTIVGITAGDPRATAFTAALAVFGLIGFACASWWVLRLFARATTTAEVEVRTGRRALRIVTICSGPAILLFGAVMFPSPNTWLIGLLASLSGLVQLVLAKRAGQLERVHGARLFQESGRGFVLARP
jgi:hypothetical protein